MPILKDIKDSIEILKSVEVLLSSNMDALSSKSIGFFVCIKDSWKKMEVWENLIETRINSLKLLKEMKPEEPMIFNEIEMSFKCARLIYLQSYLSSYWSLSDNICKFVTMILCNDDNFQNDEKSRDLVTFFVRKQKGKKPSNILSYNIMRNEFGWASGVLYAFRNQFIHDGDTSDSYQFFSDDNNFSVNQHAWEKILRKLKTEYEVDITNCRKGTEFNEDVPVDLISLLEKCEKEMDFALSFLLKSACNFTVINLGLLTGKI